MRVACIIIFIGVRFTRYEPKRERKPDRSCQLQPANPIVLVDLESDPLSQPVRPRLKCMLPLPLVLRQTSQSLLTLGIHLLSQPAVHLRLSSKHAYSQNCHNYHNYYELYYHPFRYKTANCPLYPCPNSPFCFGIHTTDLPYLQRSKFFRFDLSTFKTELCHQAHNSNKEYASCRFYHGEGDRRRNHKKVAYSHVQCAKVNCADA